MTARLVVERREAMRDLLGKALADEPEQQAWWDADDLVPPGEVFPLEEGLTLRFGDEVVEVFHPGPAHSPDGVVVHWPGRRLLFGGCMVLAGEQVGNTADADVARWPKAVTRLQALKPTHVIPGHGDRTDVDLLAHTLRLLAAHDGAP